jgi:phage-related tail protein
MFNNTVKLAKNDAALDHVEVSLIDGPTNRKTLRSSADGLTEFSIAHGESNENPGLVTSRSNVRVSLSKEIADTDKFATGYAQFTMSVPKGSFTAAEAAVIAGRLVNFLIFGDFDEEGGQIDATTMVALPRLYAGEP